MTLKLKLLTAAMVGLSFSSAAYSFTITGGIDVGGIDVFEADTTQSEIGNASQASETAWASEALGIDLTFEDKTEDVDFFVTLEDDGVIALALTSSPAYFLVKDAQDYVLFENQDSLDWGVFRLGDFFNEGKIEEGEPFSHVTEFNGGTISVPEPGTLALLGIGLLGTIVARRKRAL
jgi:hypothetical protein